MEQATPRCDTVLVVGLGLIGGSLAAALKRSGFSRQVLAWDQDRQCLEQGQAAGIIDASPDELAAAAQVAELVVIAVPTLAVESVLGELAMAGTTAVLTDVASVKGSVLDAARRVFGTVPQRFIPGHPIAGRERSGVVAADPGLFREHRVILTPQSDADPLALDTVQAMWRCCGAEVVQMEAEHHDRVLAFTSHLPHVLAYALVAALASEDSSEEIFRFAAGGFRDFTRIASSDPVMWRDIVLANRGQVLAALDHFSRTLKEIRQLVDAGDGATVHDAFAEARDARNRYLGWLAGRHDE